MKYISIDLETTGLDPKKDVILEFAAVIEDTENILPLNELPKLTLFVKHNRLVISPEVIYMHKELFTDMVGSKDFVESTSQLAMQFDIFLSDNNIKSYNSLIAAGKNFTSFDLQFLNECNFFRDIPRRFSFRTLDPSILFLRKTDDSPPN